MLADPDLPPGIDLPQLSPVAPFDLDAGRYRWLREAYDNLPRRSRVIVALRLPPPGHSPMTLREIGLWFGVGKERMRQLERQAVWALSRAWRPDGASGLSTEERAVELAPIISAALDRYPIATDESADDVAARVPEPTIVERFGARIAHERSRRGMSTRELAKRAGMHGSEISRLELAQRDPRLTTIDRVARALDLTFGALLDDDPERPPDTPLD